MALLTFRGSDRVVAAHGPALPQPDQLCGPFSARLALHALLPAVDVPAMVTLAAASGTAIWPHDLPTARPPGAPMDRTGWDGLARASSPDASGTDAAGLIYGLEATVGTRVCVVPVPGAGLTAYRLVSLLGAIAQARYPVGVLANVRTGAIAPPESGWDVGHFVVLCSIDLEHQVVMVADTYAELTGPGMTPGCRGVALPDLAQALAAPPGRGLLLLARAEDRAAMRAMVTDAGLAIDTWST